MIGVSGTLMPEESRILALNRPSAKRTFPDSEHLQQIGP